MRKERLVGDSAGPSVFIRMSINRHTKSDELLHRLVQILHEKLLTIISETSTSEFLARDPEVPGSIPGATKFSEE
jgi:hypothetical protein